MAGGRGPTGNVLGQNVFTRLTMQEFMKQIGEGDMGGWSTTGFLQTADKG